MKRLIFLSLKKIHFITSPLFVIVAIVLSGSFPVFMSSSSVYGWVWSDVMVQGGQTDQTHPHIAYSGQGSFLVVWENIVNGSSDIYGAIVSGSQIHPPATGQQQTTATPFPICTASGDQKNPLAVWNGSNYFVVWEDKRTDNSDICGARVNPSGSVLDNAPTQTQGQGGMAISAAAGDQIQPALLWNASEQNYLVIWEDHRITSSPGIYATRVSSDFQLFDGPPDTGGLLISGIEVPGTNPYGAFNGTDYLVVWQSTVDASTGDIYGCLMSASGQVLGSPVHIGGGEGLKLNPVAVSDGKDFLVVWDVHAEGSYADVVGTLISDQGVLDSRGVFAITQAQQDQLNPSAIFCENHYLIAWKDTRSGKPEVYYARLSSAGSFLDSQTKSSSGLTLGIVGLSPPDYPAAVTRMPDTGEYVIVWEEKRSNNSDIYAQTFQASSPPVLSWTGETGYQSSGVNPGTGPAGTTFEFRVKYRNVNNLAPQKAQLWIDQDDDGIYSINPDSPLMDKIMNMTAESGGNYIQGTIYKASTTLEFAGDGKINYRFVFSDGTNEATGEPVKNHPVMLGDSPASLEWMGTSDYESDGVKPNSAPGGSAFSLMIKYRDAENDPPSTAEVWVDINRDNTYSQDEKFPMAAFDTKSFSEGRGYQKSVSCLYLPDSTTSAANTVKYRFNFSNANGPVEGEPSTDHFFFVTPNSSVPLLSWTSEGGFTEGVRFKTEAGGNGYEFHVSYQDQDNDPPTLSEVWVDENADGQFSQGEKHSMEALIPSDTNMMDGKIYALLLNISLLGGENIRYKFVFSDGKNFASGEPSLNGAQIEATSPVYLTWTQDEGYMLDGVNPDSGPSGFRFEFRVKYINSNNLAPRFRQLWVDENNDGQYQESEKYGMDEIDSLDPDFSDGKVYTRSLAISPSGTPPISLAYRFAFGDGFLEATGQPTEGSVKLLILDQNAAVVDPNSQADPNSISDPNSLSDPNSPDGGGGSSNDPYAPKELQSSQGGCFILSLARWFFFSR
ncbi:MAG: hypothetical protein AB1847_11580 [bacterium]